VEDKGWPLGQRLVGIVDRPRAAFAQIAARPGKGWFIPVLILLLGLVALNLALAPHAAVEAQRQMDQQLATLPPGQADALVARMDQLVSPLFVGLMGLVAGIVGTALAILLGAVVLYFVALFTGGEGGFGPTLGVMLWAWIPFGIRALVQAAVIAAQGRLIVNQGLSYLVSVGDRVKDSQNVLYGLLAQVDLFALWHLVLVWAAALALYKLGRNKALVVVLLYAIVSLGLRVATLLIQGMLVTSL